MAGPAPPPLPHPKGTGSSLAAHVAGPVPPPLSPLPKGTGSNLAAYVAGSEPTPNQTLNLCPCTDSSRALEARPASQHGQRSYFPNLALWASKSKILPYGRVNSTTTSAAMSRTPQLRQRRRLPPTTTLTAVPFPINLRRQRR